MGRSIGRETLPYSTACFTELCEMRMMSGNANNVIQKNAQKVREMCFPAREGLQGGAMTR